MQDQDIARWTHSHVFDQGSALAERSTRLVVGITALTMLVEIGAGLWYNSMALLADGWHMGSHTVAIGLSAVAYAAARRFAQDTRFAFGTWKIEVLAGFASAILLLVVAALMVSGSVERLLWPQAIQYREAIAIAVLGLLVNLACALILGKAHPHGHAHGHGHNHGHSHSLGGDKGHGHCAPEDLNLRSAYVHVLADAATSVLAIVALLGGWLFGWSWLDPVMGLVGAVLVGLWAKGLIADTAKVLLDREMDHPVVDEIRAVVEVDTPQETTRLADLHVWRVGQGVFACALTAVTNQERLTADDIRQRLGVHEEVVHATIEMHRFSRT
jgi:cation diffusion facilitator family transporter